MKKLLILIVALGSLQQAFAGKCCKKANPACCEKYNSACPADSEKPCEGACHADDVQEESAAD